MRLPLVALALLSGCATLFAHDTTTVMVQIAPGQTVTVDGAPAGTSPTQVTVASHVDHQIVVGDRSCKLVASVGAKWVVLDVLAGLVPLVIDVATGSWRSAETATCQL